MTHDEKQIFGFTSRAPAKEGGYVSFLAVILRSDGKVMLRQRNEDCQFCEVELSPTDAAELGANLSTATFPFLPTARK